MNVITKLKKRINISKKKAAFAAGATALAATPAMATLDTTAIGTAIATAITDFSAVGVIILGGYAGIWGLKEVISFFRGLK